jgi:two-component system sensor histidine kinase RegB
VREVLDELLQTWRVVRPGVKVEVAWGQDVGDPQINVDESFSQAVTNLLNNAADASAASDSNRVRLGVAADANGVSITIEDEGPGLSKDLMQKAGKTVFTTKEGGFGLGLVLSHTSLNRLGGELTLNSRTAGGTCTAIHIPLAAQGAASG